MQQNEGYVTADDGARVYFRRLGSGSATIVVPNGIYWVDDCVRLTGGRTLLVYDLRNRGRSESIADPEKLARGIHHDVADLDAVRRHFSLDRMQLLGHSYIGLMVMLYAMKHPAHVDRVVQIGASPPDAGVQYPPQLANADATLDGFLAKFAELQRNRASLDPIEFCRRFWAILRVIYVADPADAVRINWGRCELANERAFMKQWIEYVLPSIQQLRITAADFAAATMPVLAVHGTKDRSAPYGGGRDWAMRLPNARLVTVEGAAHAPWIEAPTLVIDAIEAFLGGAWPPDAERITELERDAHREL